MGLKHFFGRTRPPGSASARRGAYAQAGAHLAPCTALCLLSQRHMDREAAHWK